jgi:3-oxoacyl-[acyl-carrier protein] reductase
MNETVACDFSGKTVVVTGGTRGIGRAMVQQLREQGAEVFFTGTAVSVSGKENGFVPLDLEDEASISRFAGFIESLPRLDALINNAGINKIDLVTEIKDEDWERIMRVNLTGAQRLTREASRKMISGGIPGRILNISSIFGVVSRSRRAAYSASKAGLIGFTRAAALDLASKNILVNALCPGFVETELTRSILSAGEMKELAEKVPLKRLAQPGEIARFAVFLCSPLNSAITGQAVVVDGGFLAL